MRHIHYQLFDAALLGCLRLNSIKPSTNVLKPVCVGTRPDDVWGQTVIQLLQDHSSWSGLRQLKNQFFQILQAGQNQQANHLLNRPSQAREKFPGSVGVKVLYTSICH